jgi:glutamate---cysteine ligase / carboxylate-amine ligase
MTASAPTPEWAEWRPHELGAYTVGIEEEVMLLDPVAWSLAHRIESVLPRIPSEVAEQTTAETHGSALELQTRVHRDVAAAGAELGELRRQLESTLATMRLRAACAGTHPFAVWQEIAVSAGERYQFVYGSMRELARREPTFALHVHVGVPEPETAIRVANRMRAHLPLLLALSANSPFWQGRDTGLASARTPLFQAFPRVGVPQLFESYEQYVEAVDLLIRCDAVPEPTFLWWDVRPQPRFGTVEVRIMDVQTRLEETAAMAALTQCMVRMEAEEGFVSDTLVTQDQVISENRFLAARDGIDAELIDPDLERRLPLSGMVEDLLVACRPHAQDLGCEAELAAVSDLARSNGASKQISVARRQRTLAGLVATLADGFGPGSLTPKPAAAASPPDQPVPRHSVSRPY